MEASLPDVVVIAKIPLIALKYPLPNGQVVAFP